MEEKIKYIRGVEGRGDDIQKLFIDMGYQSPQTADTSILGDKSYLFYLEDSTTIMGNPISSKAAKLIIENGEEMFLKPVYKFKVGDKVIFNGMVHTINSTVGKKGKPLYDIERDNMLTLLVEEEDLFPYKEREYKYNIGDKVLVNVGKLYGHIGKIMSRIVCFGENVYKLDNRDEVLREEELRPFNNKFEIGDKVIDKKGISSDRTFKVIGYCFCIDEPYYTVETLDGSTRLGFFESALEKALSDVEVKINWKFNIGDKVKVIKGAYKGKVGTVRERDMVTSQYLVKGTDSSWLFVSCDVLEAYQEPAKTWKDLIGRKIEGYTIDSDTSEIMDTQCSECGDSEKNVAATEKDAKAMLAMAQISQLLVHYGGPITDEEWKNRLITKYTIERDNGQLAINTRSYHYCFIAFHTEEQAKEFRSYPENVQLVKDFYKLSDDEEPGAEEDDSQDD